MKTLILVCSYHHKSAEKVARCMAAVLGAPIMDPQQADPRKLADYDLVGFGSGIYDAMHHSRLLELAEYAPGGGKKGIPLLNGRHASFPYEK